MTATTTGLATTPVTRAESARIEAAEARAWADVYAAAPAEFRAEVGLETAVIGGALVLAWAASGRRYFSRAIGLGVAAPATPGVVDQVLGWWAERGIDMCLVQSLPHCEPAGYEQDLAARGLEPFDRQDRVVRYAEPAPPQPPSARDLAIEPVTPATAGEWSDYIQRVYALQTGDWLPRLIGRPGWHPYVARQDGAIVAARTMYVGSGGYAWLGMDAPVPGVMTPDYEPDAALCSAIVRDGLRLGVRCFLADIEAPSDGQDTPAYADFARLGFTRPYVRTHWARIG